jgi:hypothetical protein
MERPGNFRRLTGGIGRMNELLKNELLKHKVQ